MSSYNASEIIGKTLIAAAPVDLKRLPYDSTPAVYTAARGQSIGVVYSYLLPGNGRSGLYWVFNDQYGKSYYAKHSPGLFSLTALKDQGAQTTLEVTQAAQAAQAAQDIKDLSIVDFLKLNAGKLVAVIAGAFVLKSVLPGIINKKK
jgi:hypothetical protein